MITISEKDLDALFLSFRRSKLNIARPSKIHINKIENSWKISLVFNSSEYLKRSCYVVLKPLFTFLKQEICKQTRDSSPVIWEIIRES
jgi:hypothetical protein